MPTTQRIVPSDKVIRLGVVHSRAALRQAVPTAESPDQTRGRLPVMK